jgi:hypothetical protein
MCVKKEMRKTPFLGAKGEKKGLKSSKFQALVEISGIEPLTS